MTIRTLCKILNEIRMFYNCILMHIHSRDETPSKALCFIIEYPPPTTPYYIFEIFQRFQISLLVSYLAYRFVKWCSGLMTTVVNSSSPNTEILVSTFTRLSKIRSFKIVAIIINRLESPMWNNYGKTTLRVQLSRIKEQKLRKIGPIREC